MLPQPAEKALELITKPFGLLNQGILELFKTMSLQGKNQFEIIFVPKKSIQGVQSVNAKNFSFTQTLKSISLTEIADQAIATFMIDEIDIPFSSFEYERIQNKQYVTALTHPEECTLTFLETELGLTRMWLHAWLNEIISISDDGRVRFKNNQEASKKDCYIITQGRMGIPSNLAICLSGLKIKSIENLSLSQANGENMKIAVNFAIDTAWFTKLVNFP